MNNIHNHWTTPRRDGDLNSTLRRCVRGSVIATTIATIKTFVITIKIYIISTNWLKTVEAKTTFLARNGVRMYFYAQTKLQNHVFIWKNKDCPPCFPFRRRELGSHVTWKHVNAKQWADQTFPSHNLIGQIVRWKRLSKWTNVPTERFLMRLGCHTTHDFFRTMSECKDVNRCTFCVFCSRRCEWPKPIAKANQHWEWNSLDWSKLVSG